MKKIGIIIGTEEEPITRQYYLKNKKKFECLRGLLDDLKFIPYDFALYAEAKSYEKKYNVNIIPLDGTNLKLNDCNNCDSIFCIYEGTITFMNYGIDDFNNYIKVLSKTTADVYPSMKIQKFILYKKKYMQYLEKKGYDIIDTKFISINAYKNNKDKNIKSIDKFISKYPKIIFKPELSGYKAGVKIYKNPNITSIKTYLDKTVKDTDYKNLLLQPFLDKFNKYWEIKTYWLMGKNIFSYGQKFNKNDQGYYTKPISKGGKLDDKLVNKCLKIGKNVINDLFNDHEPLVQCRIDFGCCVGDSNDKYFINEIEICPTIGQNDAHKEYFHLVGEAIVKMCV
jgi:hypothetical protein